MTKEYRRSFSTFPRVHCSAGSYRCPPSAPISHCVSVQRCEMWQHRRPPTHLIKTTGSTSPSRKEAGACLSPRSLWGSFYQMMGEDNHMLHQPTAERGTIHTVCWRVVEAKTQQVTRGSSHPDAPGRRPGQRSAVGCRWRLLAGF